MKKNKTKKRTINDTAMIVEQEVPHGTGKIKSRCAVTSV